MPRDEYRNPVEFDKINTHQRNYEFYKAPAFNEPSINHPNINTSYDQATRHLPPLRQNQFNQINQFNKAELINTPQPGYRKVPHEYSNETSIQVENIDRGNPLPYRDETPPENKLHRVAKLVENVTKRIC